MGVPVLRTVAAHDVAGNLELRCGCASRRRGADRRVNEVSTSRPRDCRDRYPHQMSAVSSSGWRWPAPGLLATLLLLDGRGPTWTPKLREQAHVWLKEIQREVASHHLLTTRGEALTLSDRSRVCARSGDRHGRYLLEGTTCQILPLAQALAMRSLRSPPRLVGLT